MIFNKLMKTTKFLVFQYKTAPTISYIFMYLEHKNSVIYISDV